MWTTVVYTLYYTVTFQFSHAKQKKVEEQETHAFFIPLRESLRVCNNVACHFMKIVLRTILCG